jgi:release factor glutamine methyltransferase
LVQSDWFAAVSGMFDLIVANPPYVAAGDPHLATLRFEPISALTGDADGLSRLRQIVTNAPKFLAPGGLLVVEHGHDQGDAVRRLFDDAGFRETRTLRDLSATDRVCVGRR